MHCSGNFGQGDETSQLHRPQASLLNVQYRIAMLHIGGVGRADVGPVRGEHEDRLLEFQPFGY